MVDNNQLEVSVRREMLTAQIDALCRESFKAFMQGEMIRVQDPGDAPGEKRARLDQIKASLIKRKNALNAAACLRGHLDALESEESETDSPDLELVKPAEDET